MILIITRVPSKKNKINSSLNQGENEQFAFFEFMRKF